MTELRDDKTTNIQVDLGLTEKKNFNCLKPFGFCRKLI